MRTLTFNRVIGTGSFGTVYRAELRVPRGFSRQCAVKVMKSTTPDQDHFRARMRDEARLLGMLADEQIVGVSDLVSAGGRDIVVMEYVDGVDLSDIIVNQPMPPRALAELGAELAGTLHRAHSAKHPNTGEPLKVVHRDVKPANVMVTQRGGVRLLDFGVARAAFSSRESETQGLVLGTLNYFPPEILAGGDPSPAVDIYGVGLVLWECATGKEWGSPQVHRKRFERRVEQRLAVIEEEYAALVPILRQILTWDPAQRPEGDEVEVSLLEAADAAAGEGLRTWARIVVPPMMEARSKIEIEDELIGITLPIDLGADGEPLQPLPHDLPDLPENPMDSMTYNDLAPPSAVDRRNREPAQLVPDPTTAPEEDFDDAADEVTAPPRPPPRFEEELDDPLDAPTELAIPRSIIDVAPPVRLPPTIPRTPMPAAPRQAPPPAKGPNIWVVVGAAIVIGSVIGVALIILVLLALILLRLMM